MQINKPRGIKAKRHKINGHKTRPWCNVIQHCTVKHHISRTVDLFLPTELFMYHPTITTFRRYGDMNPKFIFTTAPHGAV